MVIVGVLCNYYIPSSHSHCQGLTLNMAALSSTGRELSQQSHGMADTLQQSKFEGEGLCGVSVCRLPAK